MEGSCEKLKKQFRTADKGLCVGIKELVVKLQCVRNCQKCPGPGL
jgi:hypothetical protein